MSILNTRSRAFIGAAGVITGLAVGLIGTAVVDDNDSQSAVSFAQLAPGGGELVLVFNDDGTMSWRTLDNPAPPTTEAPPSSTTSTSPPTTTTQSSTTTTVPVTSTSTSSSTSSTLAPTTTAPAITSTSTTVVSPPSSTLPPPPLVAPVLVGAAMARDPATESWTQATADFETLIAADVDIARRFSGSTFPTTYQAQTSMGAAVDVGQRHRFISVKGDPTAAQWSTFLNSIPVDGFDTWVTINHEPENDGNLTAAQFKAKLALMLERIELTGRQDLHPSFVLMAWTERNSGNSELWFPDQIAKFTYGIDGYDPNNVLTLQASIGPAAAAWKAAGGGPWMVTETGTHRTGQAAVVWIDDGFDWCRADPTCLGIHWFHSSVGAEGPWWLPAGAPALAYGDQVGQLRTAA